LQQFLNIFYGIYSSRSRSRSRSRERDNRYGSRRRDRDSRSRSRDRDYHRRNGRDRDRDTKDTKEQVKRLPMIGKMPLYKRSAFSRDGKKFEEDKKENMYGTSGPVDTTVSHLKHDDASNMSIASDNSLSRGEYGSQKYTGTGAGEYGPVPPAHFASSTEATGYSATTASASMLYSSVNSSASLSSKTKEGDEDDTLKPPGEKEAPGNGLPDDFQQALDIIYSGGSSKPPGTAAPTANPSGTDTAAGHSYGKLLGVFTSAGVTGYKGIRVTFCNVFKWRKVTLIPLYPVTPALVNTPIIFLVDFL